MSYGIELVNDYGYQVATMNDVNYVLRSAGQITNSQFKSVSSSSYVGISMMVGAMNAPLVFFRSMNADARLTQKPGTNLLYPDFAPAGFKTTTANVSIDVYKWWNKNIGTVQYYIFDRWIPSERSSYGMQIFDQSGGIIFDSGWKFLKLRKVIWLDPGYPNHANHTSGANWTNIGSAGSGTLAVCMPHPRPYIIPTGVFGYMTYECIHLDANNNVFCSLIPTGEYLDMAPQQGWVGSMRSQVMIADVDGLPTTYNPVTIRGS